MGLLARVIPLVVFLGREALGYKSSLLCLGGK